MKPHLFERLQAHGGWSPTRDHADLVTRRTAASSGFGETVAARNGRGICGVMPCLNPIATWETRQIAPGRVIVFGMCEADMARSIMAAEGMVPWE